jgi:hypothetical protein
MADPTAAPPVLHVIPAGIDPPLEQRVVALRTQLLYPRCTINITSWSLDEIAIEIGPLQELTAKIRVKKLVLWIRIRIGFGFNGVTGSVSEFAIRIRIQEGKNDPQT